MAVDSVLFHGVVAAQAYAVGDRIPMGVIRGPAVVRDGYGAAKLKKAFTWTGASVAGFKIVVKNSNWVDEFSNPAISMSETSLDENSVSVNRGHDCPLTPNSSWMVYAECTNAGTETTASECICLMDIDYPAVPSVSNPRAADGFPVTIDDVAISLTNTVHGSANLNWAGVSVDLFKAGYKYLLTQASFKQVSTDIGFIAIEGAAGQNGLQRIIPVRSGGAAGIRYLIDYTTPLVQGPMNIFIAAIGSSGSGTPYLYMDFVKK